MLAVVTDVTDATFGTAVMERSMTVPVVVDLWAEWCGPCKTLGPIIEKVVGETSGAVELAKVDVDANPQVAQAFNVQSIPAVFAIHEGKIVDSFVGALPGVGGARVRRETRARVRRRSTSWWTPATRPHCAPRSNSTPPTSTRRLPWLTCLRRDDRLDEADAVLKPFENVVAAKTILARIRLQRSGVSLDGDLDLTLEHLLEQSARATSAKDSLLEILDALGPRRPALRVVPAKTRQSPLLVRVYQPPATDIRSSLGATTYDLTSRALVMGILNRTRDSFYEPAATFDLDALFERADRLVDEGADLLDIGGVKAGPGDDVDEGEELERVVPVVTELVKRFDVPISIDTWRASVAQAAFAEGACIGNDISGFADDEYLPVAAAAGATVVATHIRLQPRVADPDSALRRRHRNGGGVPDRTTPTGPRRRASREDRIVVDAGLDLGKTAAQSLQLLRDSERLAGLGAPLLLSASNKTFLGVMFDLPVSDRREPSLAATALGIAAGCRIVRVHDVQGTVRVRDVIARLLEEGRA